MKRLILAAAVLCIACGGSNDKTETTNTGGDTTGDSTTGGSTTGGSTTGDSTTGGSTTGGSTTGGSTTGGGTTGGGTTGGGTSSGSAWAVVLPATTCEGRVVTALLVGVADRAVTNVCEASAAGNACISYKNTESRTISIFRASESDTVTAIAPGTYEVGFKLGTDGTLTAATVAEFKTDATCQGTGESATSGTVTVTAVAGTRVAGSYDVQVSGERHQGTFDARDCSANLPATTSFCDGTTDNPTGRTCSPQQTQCL